MTWLHGDITHLIACWATRLLSQHAQEEFFFLGPPLPKREVTSPVGDPFGSLGPYPRPVTGDPWFAATYLNIHSCPHDRDHSIIHHIWMQPCCVGPRITWPHNRGDKSQRKPGPNRKAINRSQGALFFRTVTDPQAVENPLGLLNHAVSVPRT